MVNLIKTRPLQSSLQEPRCFDARSAQAFVYKFNSPETRKAYTRAIQDFFEFCRFIHQSEVQKEHVIAYRERLVQLGRRPRTISQRLAALRSYFEALVAEGMLERNPASTRLVQPPKVSRAPSGRALSKEQTRHVLAAPDCRTVEGARDHALMLIMFRLSIRLTEVCTIRLSSIGRSASGWVLKCKVKGGEEHLWPLPVDIKQAIDEYLRLDTSRRRELGTDGSDAWLFQPVKNHRTLIYNKPLSQRMVQKIVAKWGDYSGVGKLTPHDLRRTCLTEMLKKYPAHRVQMVSKHKDLNTLTGYDHDRDNLENSPVNSFNYDE